MTKEIIYFGDPMCSWCWGFAPVISKIQADYGDTLKFSIVLGGLHAFDTKPMSQNYKDTIRHHWESVNQTTGAVFDFGFFDRDGFVLDTEPACRAVVTARSMGVENLLGFYESVSRSFYTENKDTTHPDTFLPLAVEAGLDEKEFSELFLSDDIKQATKNDFFRSQSLGVTGFPTLVVSENDQLALLTAGYQPHDNLKPALEHWLENGFQS